MAQNNGAEMAQQSNLDGELSLWARYLLEREGVSTLEWAEGFATFKLGLDTQPKYVYLQDIYVLPEFRELGLASELEQAVIDVAAAAGCELIYGSVSPADKAAPRMRKILSNRGYEFSHEADNLEFYKRPLNGPNKEPKNG